MMKTNFIWGVFIKMKSLLYKIIFLLLLFLLLNNTGFSQRIYSKQNLEKASLEELNVYLRASEKKKQTGTIMSVAGPVAFVVGFAVFSTSYDTSNYTNTDIGGYILLAGLVTTAIGVPKLITGSSRVRKIKEIMEAKKVSIELAPCNFNNPSPQNAQPGITLQLKF